MLCHPPTLFGQLDLNFALVVALAIVGVTAMAVVSILCVAMRYSPKVVDRALQLAIKTMDALLVLLRRIR